MIREKQRSVSSGWGIVGILLATDLVALYGIYLSVEADNPAGIMTSIVVAVLAALMYPGLFIVNPNEGKVLQLFGDYAGRSGNRGFAGPTRSTRRSGSRCASATSRAPSSRSTTTKATRSRSPPWSSGGSSIPRKPSSRCDDYENYVHVQTESAVRNLATSYTYDTHDEAAHFAARPHGERSPNS